MPADKRPPRFPPPKFPMERPKLFATTPPALFPVILGLVGLGLALRKASAVLALPEGPVEALLGALVAYWAFAVLALTVKVIRRPAVLVDDLRPVPGRAGLAAASMSGMAMAGVLLPYAPQVALGLVLVALVVHGALAILLFALLTREPGGRTVNPSWHLSFVGFIVAAPVLLQLGWEPAARVIFALSFMAACVIWLLSVFQLIARIPPAPLRPMLAIHLAPASLLSLSATLLGYPTIALVLAAGAGAILLALVAAARWLLAAGLTPIWGALTFPLAAAALAFLNLPDARLGLALTLAALVIIPPIAWSILKQWPAGRLAAKTNAARA